MTAPDKIFELRELTPDDIVESAKRLSKSHDMTLLRHVEDGLYDLYFVESGSNTYQVTRMGNFVSCDCPGFTAGHKICKHVSLALPPTCIRCYRRPTLERGGLCDLCGPGKLLPVGTRFTCHKYFGKRAVMEVCAVIDEDGYQESTAVDITQPENASVPRPLNHFTLRNLDFYRGNGTLVIVEKIDF